MRSWRRVATAGAALLVLGSAGGTASAQSFFKEKTGDPLGPFSEWTNQIRLDDLDGDGDLDVVVPNCGGFFSPPWAQPFRVFRNDGAATFTEAPEMLGGPFASTIRVVDLADVDADGDLDLFAPSAGGTADRLYMNDGTGHFTDEAATRIASSSHSAGVRFADVDGDGDADLVVAQGYASADPVPARLFRNDGEGAFNEAFGMLPASGPGDIDDIDAFDADGDFDLDLLLTSHAGAPALWINDGLGMFTDASGQLGPLAGAYKYGPTACDVDGDGDRDLWFDNAGPGYTEALLLNDGTGHFVDETIARVVGNPGADDNGVVCADVDLDGDDDAIVVSLSGTERVLRNDGTGHFTNVGGFPAVGDSSLWLDLGDLDGDGRLDGVTGQGESGDLRNRVYLGVDDNPPDTRAPVVTLGPLPASLADGASVPVRLRVVDRVLVDAGPRVRAELRVTVDGMAAPPLPARFVGGDLFQGTVHGTDGTVLEVRACATDMQGNVGCSAPRIVSGPGTSSGGGSGDAASATGVGGGSGFTVPSNTGGCSCTVSPRERSVAAHLVVWVAACGALRRRRVGRVVRR